MDNLLAVELALNCVEEEDARKNTQTSVVDFGLSMFDCVAVVRGRSAVV